jgi:myo-inositol 2-dehydrogenase/D-chiro-inositol 1-dehydrogenase
MQHYRVGLVGAGGISHAHAPSWIALGVDVTVWSDAGASDLGERYGLAVATSFEHLLEQCDVIDVCTPTPTHAEIVMRSIEAGRDVVCEKPLARTVADALEIVGAARQHGVSVLPGHVVRYFPEYEALHAAVVAGRIGDPAVLRFSRGGQAPANGWFFDEGLSGGIILDQMLHDLDQARWLAGEVVSVSATQNPPTVDGVVPRTVVAHVVLTHRSGAISLVQGVWGPPGTRFATSFDVAGSAGRLQYDSRHGVEVEADLPGAAPGASYLPALTGANPYATELGEFLTAFGDPAAEPRVTLADGVIAVAIAEAALEALHSGETVTFDEPALLDLIGAIR